MSEDNLQPVELSVKDIADVEKFETARGEIYKSTQTGDSERMNRLTELAGSMAVNRGDGDSDEPVSIQDRVLDILTSGEPLARSHDAMKYRISVDPQGNVTEISRVLSLPEDALATDRARKSSAGVPWGPKQNHSSFNRNYWKSKKVKRKKARI